MKLQTADKAITVVGKRMSKYKKKGSKEVKAAMLKIKILKRKLKQAQRSKLVKAVVKKGGNRAEKAAGEKAKAGKQATKLAWTRAAMARIQQKMLKHKKGTAYYNKSQAAMLK